VVQGVDYAGGRIPGAVLNAAGYSFVCRYITDGGSDLPDKQLTAAEASDLQANGIGVVSNWESTGTTPQQGYDAGVSDATQALTNHFAAGGPGYRPIYFSIDWDAAESDQPAINAYFQGVASVIGLQWTGAYGGYWPLSRLLDAGLITWGWQTQAWSSNPEGLAPDGPNGCYLDPRVQILQVSNAGFTTIAGVQCDIDSGLTTDYGQWSAAILGGPTVTPPPVVVAPPPPPVVTPPPAPPTVDQVLASLVSELSASGSLPLAAEDPTQPNLTLRGAIQAILWKNTTLLDLTDRPRDPTLQDDLYGHVLNLRAEGLITQALLTALAEAAKIDTATVIAEAKAAFAPPAAT
jgi:hypothetical protein